MSLLQHADVGEHAFALLLGVADLEFQSVGAQPAGIAHLAAGFGVERRVIQHHHPFFAGVERFDRLASAEQRDHGRLFLQPVVAVELGATLDAEIGGLAQTELAVGAGAGALRFHFPVEAGGIELQAALAGDVGGQVHRKAVGVVELEHGLAGDDRAGQGGDVFFQQLHAMGQGFGWDRDLGKGNASGYRVAEFPAVLHRRMYGVSKAKIAQTIRSHLGFQGRILVYRTKQFVGRKPKEVA